jgi:hypothetical protein
MSVLDSVFNVGVPETCWAETLTVAETNTTTAVEPTPEESAIEPVEEIPATISVSDDLPAKEEPLTMTLRPYQKDAVDKTFACLKENPKHGYCVSAPCASGKSLMIAEMARRVVSGEELVESDGRVLVVSHVQEIVQQDYEHLDQLLPGQVGVFSAGLKRRDVSENVIVAGIQSVYRSTRLGQFDMLVVDECFPEGTLIDTPSGNVPIEDIYVGAFVYNANGLGIVEAISVRSTTKLVNTGLLQCS